MCHCVATSEDDVMATDRVELQLRTAIDNPTDTVSLFQKYVNATNHSYILAQISVYFLSQLVGSCFTRTPAGSTERYTRWCNTLSPTQLHTQVTFTPSPTTHTHCSPPTDSCRLLLRLVLHSYNQPGSVVENLLTNWGLSRSKEG